MKAHIIEENLDRGLSVLLATTTWLFIFPSVQEKLGIKVAIIACILTALVEFTGYYSRLMGSRTGSYFLSSYGFTIIIASATLSLWGGTLQKHLMIESGAKQAIAKANSDLDAIEDKKNKQASRIAMERKSFDSRIRRQEDAAQDEFKRKLKNATSRNFAERYTSGLSTYSYKKSHPEYFTAVTPLEKDYDQKIAQIRSQQFTTHVTDYSSREKGVTIVKDAEMKAAEMKGSAMRWMIIIIDVIGGFLGIFRFVKSLNEGSDCERPSMAIAIVSAMEYKWSVIAASFSPPPVEEWNFERKEGDPDYWRREEMEDLKAEAMHHIGNLQGELDHYKRAHYEVSEQARMLASDTQDMDQMIEHQSAVYKQKEEMLIQQISSLEKQIETAKQSTVTNQSVTGVTEPKRNKDRNKNEERNKAPQETGVEVVTGETKTVTKNVSIGKQGDVTVVSYNGELWNRNRIRSNWRSNLNRYEKSFKKGRHKQADLDRAREMFELWKMLKEHKGETVSENDFSRMEAAENLNVVSIRKIS